MQQVLEVGRTWAAQKGINVNTHGMPIRMVVMVGPAEDCSQASALIVEIDAQYLLADKGYDTDANIAQAKEQGMKPLIPPRKNRKQFRDYDSICINYRHRIENAFLHIKRWRGIAATRYAKNAASL